jgi:hypothetical protein
VDYARRAGLRVAVQSGAHNAGPQGYLRDALLVRTKVRYNAVTPAAYSALGFPGADELANMFQFNADFEDEYCAARDLDTSRRLHPGLSSYREWLEQHAEQIPIG